MSLTRIVVGWLLVWVMFLFWEALEARILRVASSEGAGPHERAPMLRRPPGAYFIEALLLALIAGLWFGSLGHGGWMLLFGLLGLLVEWTGWMRIAGEVEPPLPALVHIVLGGARGVAAGGLLAFALG
jgi:hypothetical protein